VCLFPISSNKGYLQQSTSKGYGYTGNPISDDFALPPPQVPRQQTGNESIYAESETRGSHHPSHLQEYGNQDDDPNDPDWQPEDNYSNIRQRIEDWRTPQVSQVYQEQTQENPTEEEQIMAARTQEVQRLKLLDELREKNKHLEDERIKQEGIRNAFKALKTNQMQQEEELQRLLEEQREMEEEIARLKKLNQSYKDKKSKDQNPGDPIDPDDGDPDDDNSDDEESDDESDDSSISPSRPRGLKDTHKPRRHNNGLNNIKLPTPSRFNGTYPRVEDWLTEVNRYLSFSQMDNNQCINYAAMLLSGPAQTWWNHLE
jgi:hypothetical protein